MLNATDFCFGKTLQSRALQIEGRTVHYKSRNNGSPCGCVWASAVHFRSLASGQSKEQGPPTTMGDGMRLSNVSLNQQKPPREHGDPQSASRSSLGGDAAARPGSGHVGGRKRSSRANEFGELGAMQQGHFRAWRQGKGGDLRILTSWKSWNERCLAFRVFD
jgi:hypothetical protein